MPGPVSAPSSMTWVPSGLTAVVRLHCPGWFTLPHRLMGIADKIGDHMMELIGVRLKQGLAFSQVPL